MHVGSSRRHLYGLRPLLLVSLLLAGALSVRCERLPLETFTSRSGLPHSSVYNIETDSHGFLWLCTPEGLVRFDGYAFVSYGREQGLPDQSVSDVLESRDGAY